MVILRFKQEDQERALGFLARRFPGRSWSTGQVMVPEPAIQELKEAGFSFDVEGKATYEQLAPLRNSPANAA